MAESGSRAAGAWMPFIRLLASGVALSLVPSASMLVALVVFDWPAHAARGWMLGGVVVVTAAIVYWRFQRMHYLLQTLSGLLEALREGDYTLRGRLGNPLGKVIYDVNALAVQLQKQRIHFEESLRLLNKTLDALDSAVLVFDDKRKLRFLNPAAASLLDAGAQIALERSATDLGLDAYLDENGARAWSCTFPGRTSRFFIRTAALVHEGRKGCLLVISDIGRALREEERDAWQRLQRVLSHEVKNSLTPISSIADTLATIATRQPLPEDLQEDLVTGLRVIGDRAQSLDRFLAGYGRLTHLPTPERRDIDLGEVVRKVVRLEPSRTQVHEGEALQVQADPDQIEQALINLLKNALEAMHGTDAKVQVRWRRENDLAVIEIVDDGIGPPRSENLFVPFFTTKPGGSGIGLMLARAIAEAHDGNVSLEARTDGPGAIARFWLPLVADGAASA